MIKYIQKAVILSAAILSLSSAQAAKPPIVSTLSNGLKVVIKQVNKPNVSVGMIWYKVGSADEPGGITGISHALEHMMFKGTPNYPPNAYSKIISGYGGQENAFTNKDYTAYFAKIKGDKLPEFLKLESDRMQHLTLDAGEFQKEIKVVQEERHLRTDNNPQSLLYERFMASAHLAAPYHHPVVGWMNDLKNMSIDDLKAWYQQWYAPNNATIVIVGDVDPQETLQKIKSLFGSIPSKPIPTRKPQLAPPPIGSKEILVNPSIKTNVPMVIIGYTTPSLVTAKEQWQPYALEVAAGILSGGNSARLPKELVRQKQSAIEASADYNMYSRYDNQFMLFGAVNNMKKMPQLKQDLLDQIKKLQQFLVSPGELKRIKNQVIAENVFEKDSVFGQAMEIGVLETIGIGHQASIAYVSKINAVTAKQIQEVAKLYFTPQNMTVATLVPNTPPTNQAKAGAPS
jgi:zinc protease